MTHFTKFGPTALIIALSTASSQQFASEPKQAADKPAQPTFSGLPTYDKNIVAYVNGQPITRLELAEDLVAHRGREHIQLMINRRIIEQAAKSAGITVTDTEIDAEINQLVKFANLSSTREFEDKILKSPKYKTTLSAYREDVVKQSLYMRKLAGQRLTATEDEVRQAYEAKFGEKVKCRMIVVPDQKAGLELHARIRQEAAETKDPKDALYKVFTHYARQQVDGQLAAVAGDIQPIGHFALSNNLEKTAFALRDNEMSEVLEIPEGNTKAYIILWREKTIPPDTRQPYEKVREELRQDLLDRKMRAEVPQLFRQLRDNAVVRDYLNNEMDIKDVLQLVPTQSANRSH